MEINDLMIKSKTYEKIREHRQICNKWGKNFCLKCFGGGLTKYTESILNEELVFQIPMED